MGLVFLLALGLSMDAALVSLANGLSSKKLSIKYLLLSSICFGLMQGLMPLAGYFLGAFIFAKLENMFAYIAFTLLFIVGFKMVYEAIKEIKECKIRETKDSTTLSDNPIHQNNSQQMDSNPNSQKSVTKDNQPSKLSNGNQPKNQIYTTLVQGIATSIDAFAVGMTLIALGTNVYLSVSIIAAVTFVLCCLAVLVGFKFGKTIGCNQNYAQLVGGLLLITLGISFLIR